MAKFCQVCGGSVTNENALFCDKCGAKILDTSKDTQPPISQTPAIQKPVTKKRSTGEWIVLCCGGIILLVVVAGLLGAFATQPVSNTVSSSSYSATAVSTPSVKLIRIDSIQDSRNEYGWSVFKGVIVNDDSKSHSVSAYIDLYDKNNVKFDHLLIFEDVDAHGKTSFETTSTNAENYVSGVTYKYYIDSVY